MENASLDEFLDNPESEEKSKPDEGSEGKSGARNDGESGDGEKSENQSRAQNNEMSGDGEESENQSSSRDNGCGDGAESRGGETARDDTPGDRDGSDSTEGIGPPTSTSRWQADGQDCVVCERGVRRLWSDDGRLVCADCKDWA